MEKYLIGIALLLASSIGCSEFDTNVDDKGLDANAKIKTIRGLVTSSKLASDIELADTEELASTAAKVAGSMVLSLPTEFNRLTNMSNGTSQLSVESELRRRIAGCDMLTVSESSSRTYQTKSYYYDEDEFCDLKLTGSYTNGISGLGTFSMTRTEEALTLTTTDEAAGQIQSVSLKLLKVVEANGVVKMGKTRSESQEVESSLTVNLTDGTEYKLNAISTSGSTSTMIADNRQNSTRTVRFVAGAEMPEENVVYEWFRKTGDKIKTEEYQEVNGIRVESF